MVWDIVKAPFKAIGKAVKWVGKQIMKGFGKVGRFMNKFGILGQVGMMFITGGISNAMFAGLKTLGQGFMTGLSTSGTWGELAHKVITGVSKIAKIPGNAVGTAAKEAFGSITDAVVGSLQDTYSYISNKIPGFGNSEKIQKMFGTDGYFDTVSETLLDAGKRGWDAPSKAWDAAAQSVTDAKKFLGQRELWTRAGYTPATAPDIRTYDVKTGTEPIKDKRGKTIKDPTTGKAMRRDVYETVQKDIKYSGKNLDLYEQAADRAGLYLEPDEALMGQPQYPVAETGAEYMEGFQQRQKSLLAAEKAYDDYSALTSALDPQMVKDPAIIKQSTGQPIPEVTFGELTSRKPTEGLLRRSGSAMADEARDWFTLQKFGSSGMQGVSQSLIAPTRPEGVALSLPSATPARSQSGAISDTIKVMTEQQWRDEQAPNYLLAWDTNPDLFYDGLENVNQSTYNQMMGYDLERPKGTLAFPIG